MGASARAAGVEPPVAKAAERAATGSSAAAPARIAAGDALLGLQSRAGNRAVLRVLARGGAGALVQRDEEEDARTQAQQIELASHGHSIGRHGPEVTDDQLRTRLTTGVAPDDVLSPAPGYSSRFTSYRVWIRTRQAALDRAAAAHATAMKEIADLLPRLPRAKANLDRLDQWKADAGVKRQQAHNAFQKAKGQKGENSPEALEAKDTLDRRTARVGKLDDLAKRFAKEQSDRFNTFVLPVEKVDLRTATPTSFRTLKSYRVVIDHNDAIGAGWKGSGDPTKTDLDHKGKKVEGAKVWAATEATAPLTKSYTTLDLGAQGGQPILDDTGMPNPAITPATWNVVQHFPAPPDEPVGIFDPKE